MTNIVPTILALLILAGIMFAIGTNVSAPSKTPLTSTSPSISPATTQTPTPTATPMLEKIRNIFTSPKQAVEPINTCEQTVTCVSETTGQTYEVCANEDEVDPCGPKSVGPPQTCRFCLLADCQEGYQCVCTDAEHGSCQPYEGQGIGH